MMPELRPRQFALQEGGKSEAIELIIEGTDRRRQRPQSPKKQALHYSGKHKAHSDKKVVVVHAKTKRVEYLSQTYAGKTHDKKIADQEALCYPRHTILSKDTGFQGYEPPVGQTRQPKKSPATGTDRSARSGTSGCSPRIRARVEHALVGVKRARIVKDILRNTPESFSDLEMAVAGGLHNLRVQVRKRRLKI